MTPEQFITRWQNVGGSERANYQLFIADLCALLELPKPDPAQDDTRDNAYVFERRVIFKHGDGGSSNAARPKTTLVRCRPRRAGRPS